MCVIRDAMFASLGETEMGLDGKMYMAMYVGDVLTWVPFEDDTEAKKKRKPRRKPKCKFPEIPIDYVCEGDIYTGEDGNSYIAKVIEGKMRWKLYDETTQNKTVNVVVNVTVNITI